MEVKLIRNVQNSFLIRNLLNRLRDGAVGCKFDVFFFSYSPVCISMNGDGKIEKNPRFY